MKDKHPTQASVKYRNFKKQNSAGDRWNTTHLVHSTFVNHIITLGGKVETNIKSNGKEFNS
jgi:hypothetical protein